MRAWNRWREAVAQWRALYAAAQTALTALTALTLLATPARAAERLPSLAELEAAGATIGEIRIVAQDIFDEDNPRENNALFRLANRLHIRTRPGVVERQLLFRSGTHLRVREIDETERLLRANRGIYDVQIVPVAVRDGVVDLEVRTRDTWSLDPGFSVGRTGGANTSGVGVREYNLLGTGIQLGVSRSKGVDRTSTQFSLSNPHLFGTWAGLDFVRASSDDGSGHLVSLVRPFYALDARWTAGAITSREDRVDNIYNAGEEIGAYRHSVARDEVFGGLSEGLVDGWVQRWTVGVVRTDDRFAVEPGSAAVGGLPDDRKVVAPYLRWQLIEDRIDRERNRNLIGRPEFFALGLVAAVQFGWSSAALGATATGPRLSAIVSHGFDFFRDDTLVATAQAWSEPMVDGPARRRLGLAAQYYRPRGAHRLLYASVAADASSRSDPADPLLLGGDNGLRGFPLRYQAGTRRVLATVEQRFFTDLYVWQLFRVGAAAFVDVGRAWGGENTNQVDPGWLGTAGAGLRIVNDRSSFANVLHLDIAVPLGARGNVSKAQFLLKTRTTF